MSSKIPIEMLFESQGHVVVIETITGDVLHGKLLQVEVNMNCEMQYVSVKYKNGETVDMESLFIRGSKIVFLVLPSIFNNHPVFDTLVRNAVKPPQIQNKPNKKKFRKGNNPQTTPKNVKGTPQGPSGSKKKGGKNPQTTSKNVKGTPQGSSASNRNEGTNPQITPMNMIKILQRPSTSIKKGG